MPCAAGLFAVLIANGNQATINAARHISAITMNRLAARKLYE
jgi:hypothetical protein